MFNIPRDQVIQNVLPTYDDFVKQLDDNRFGEARLVRKAMNAATALFHLWEYLPGATRPDRKQLQNDHDAFKLISDIANVTKHKNIDRQKPRVSSADQLYEMLSCTSYLDDVGEYYDARTEVWVDEDDGTVHNVAVLLHKTLEMWRVLPQEMGVCSFVERPAPFSEVFVLRTKAVAPTIEIMNGEARALRQRFLEYDMEQGRRVPVDLTGAVIKFRVWKNPELTVSFAHPEVGEVQFDFEVPLRRETASHYYALKSDAEREAFVAHLKETDLDVARAFAVALSKSTGRKAIVSGDTSSFKDESRPAVQ